MAGNDSDLTRRFYVERHVSVHCLDTMFYDAISRNKLQVAISKPFKQGEKLYTTSSHGED